MDFTIRDARPSDGEFIARNVLAAMGYDVFPGSDSDQESKSEPCQWESRRLSGLSGRCARPDTLYSFARTRIACVDGKAVGSLTAYSGDDYPAVKKLTWSLLDSVFKGSGFSCSSRQNASTDEDTSKITDNNQANASEPECLPGEST